ncbi:hypothetical protein [Novipirellula artificiosorum]|uniref:Secreted protein n=1 Tax=Novipirellula artificiosorum TaxID=2528016 RepID=A0A5C6DK76_9BACT|nr:hypothetical protein [Novipirellula artificiosorum]TWU37022.1 hypothetical protein Poly41_31480 [Novipirellula artificiosorum]
MLYRFLLLAVLAVPFSAALGCGSSSEPVPVTTSEEEIAAYEAGLEETDGGSARP